MRGQRKRKPLRRQAQGLYVPEDQQPQLSLQPQLLFAAAAAAVVIAAAVVSAVAAAISAAIAAATAVAAAATAAAEQDDQDDDPVTTEAVVIPHIHIPPVRCEAGKGLSSSYAGGAMWCQLSRGESTDPGCGQLVFAEQARRLELLGQGLVAAAEGYVQGIVGDVGHVGPEEGILDSIWILPLCESPQLQGTGEGGSVVVTPAVLYPRARRRNSSYSAAVMAWAEPKRVGLTPLV